MTVEDEKVFTATANSSSLPGAYSVEVMNLASAQRLRVEAARRRLEESCTGLAQVAHECGFGSADSMRRSFLRVLRVAPADYRRRFHHRALPVLRKRNKPFSSEETCA